MNVFGSLLRHTLSWVYVAGYASQGVSPATVTPEFAWKVRSFNFIGIYIHYSYRKYRTVSFWTIFVARGRVSIRFMWNQSHIR